MERRDEVDRFKGMLKSGVIGDPRENTLSTFAALAAQLGNASARQMSMVFTACGQVNSPAALLSSVVFNDGRINLHELLWDSSSSVHQKIQGILAQHNIPPNTSLPVTVEIQTCVVPGTTRPTDNNVSSHITPVVKNTSPNEVLVAIVTKPTAGPLTSERMEGFVLPGNGSARCTNTKGNTNRNTDIEAIQVPTDIAETIQIEEKELYEQLISSATMTIVIQYDEVQRTHVYKAQASSHNPFRGGGDVMKGGGGVMKGGGDATRGFADADFSDHTIFQQGSSVHNPLKEKQVSGPFKLKGISVYLMRPIVLFTRVPLSKDEMVLTIERWKSSAARFTETFEKKYPKQTVPAFENKFYKVVSPQLNACHLLNPEIMAKTDLLEMAILYPHSIDFKINHYVHIRDPLEGIFEIHINPVETDKFDPIAFAAKINETYEAPICEFVPCGTLGFSHQSDARFCFKMSLDLLYQNLKRIASNAHQLLHDPRIRQALEVDLSKNDIWIVGQRPRFHNILSGFYINLSNALGFQATHFNRGTTTEGEKLFKAALSNWPGIQSCQITRSTQEYTSSLLDVQFELKLKGEGSAAKDRGSEADVQALINRLDPEKKYNIVIHPRRRETDPYILTFDATFLEDPSFIRHCGQIIWEFSQSSPILRDGSIRPQVPPSASITQLKTIIASLAELHKLLLPIELKFGECQAISLLTTLIETLEQTCKILENPSHTQEERYYAGLDIEAAILVLSMSLNQACGIEKNIAAPAYTFFTTKARDIRAVLQANSMDPTTAGGYPNLMPKALQGPSSPGK